MRRPASSYCPPWHGQEKPTAVGATGQPTCMQRFENTTNMASSSSQWWLLPPVDRT